MTRRRGSRIDTTREADAKLWEYQAKGWESCRHGKGRSSDGLSSCRRDSEHEAKAWQCVDTTRGEEARAQESRGHDRGRSSEGLGVLSSRHGD